VPKDSSAAFEIGEMREADLDEVLGIEKRSFVAPWSKRLFRETLSFPLSFNLVIRKKVDNKVAGYANFYVIGDEVQVLNIAVAPESRKEGLAMRLIRHAIDVLGERGAKEFFLEVREGNGDAIRLYEKLGFVKVGRRKKYYRETNEDALVMYLKADHAPDR
jgi:[ribosomal protein S18]-alanine N-acetyltransferase